ncbi:HdeD family acid-resistance protein [Haladaptatus sp. NG-WS-4]
MSTEVSDTTERSTVDTTWRTLMGMGAILAVLGVIAIFFPFVTGIALSILLGGALLVGAILHAVHAFSAGDWKGVLWQVILVVVYGIAGLSLVFNPLLGLTTLTLLLVAYLVVDGIVELVMGFVLRPEKNWAWVVASGFLSLLLGGLLWVGWPATAAWALGLLLGVSLLTSGLSMVGLAMGGREAASRPAAQRTDVRT